MRVVVLDHTAEVGGAELALVRLCAAIDASLDPTIDVRVVLFADGPLRERLEHLGTRVEVLPLDPSVALVDRETAGRASLGQLARAVRLVPFTWRLARRLRALHPDVVHTTSLKADLLGIVPAALARRPLVWHVHDRVSPDYLPAVLARLVRVAARLPAAVVVNSRATAATLPVASTVAYPGFAPEQASSESRAVVGPAGRAADHDPVVGMVGRISPTKGQLELVRAAAEVLLRHPRTTFRIAGDPLFGAEDYAIRVRAEADRLGIADRIEWVGFQQDVAAELDRLDVFVHASPVPEPFGQVVVEAMVRGVPVVATRAGGVSEIVEPADRSLGLLVDPGDAKALAGAIVAVLDDPVGAGRRADEARADALVRFPVSRTVEVVTDVWRRVAARARPRRP